MFMTSWLLQLQIIRRVINSPLNHMNSLKVRRRVTNSNIAYNKWHETELERWLSDHDVPFPKAADRKDLQDIVQRNWQSAIESPYLQWDTKRLSSYLKSQGREIEKGAEQNKDALLSQVKSSWHDADAQAHSTYDDVKSWIFNR